MKVSAIIFTLAVLCSLPGCKQPAGSQTEVQTNDAVVSTSTQTNAQ